MHPKFINPFIQAPCRKHNDLGVMAYLWLPVIDNSKIMHSPDDSHKVMAAYACKCNFKMKIIRKYRLPSLLSLRNVVALYFQKDGTLLVSDTCIDIFLVFDAGYHVPGSIFDWSEDYSMIGLEHLINFIHISYGSFFTQIPWRW